VSCTFVFTLLNFCASLFVFAVHYSFDFTIEVP